MTGSRGAVAADGSATLACDYFADGRCRSCTQLRTPIDAQLAAKAARCQALLPQLGAEAWLPAYSSPVGGFRNKAKMVVGGTVAEPTLGILGPRGGVDLRECGLHEPVIRDALPVLADFLTTARLTPYQVRTRRGEAKHVLVTASPDGELMVRFVLRSQEAVARIRKHLPALLSRLPAAVVSVNLQPEPKAVIEGPEEIVLTERTALPMRLQLGRTDGPLTLWLRPQAFFQTNTRVAEALYRQAADWAEQIRPRSVLDLYCGVGGFALALAGPGRTVLGVELSQEAARAASDSAHGIPGVRFQAGDAGGSRTEPASDLVVVNPPRRGLDADTCGWLEECAEHVVYSSCNPVTLARDLSAMPRLRPVAARVFDMFPNTEHLEVMVRLTRP